MPVELLVALLLAAGLAVSGEAAAAERIEVKAEAFTSTTYLTEAEQAEIRKGGILKGFGEAEYAFTVPAAGWYEMWAEAAQWSTDLLLDGKFLIHTNFASGVWPAQGGAERVLNVYLTEGQHTLLISRPWPFGLPYLRRIAFEPATDVTGMVRTMPAVDRLQFRRGETLPLRLTAGRQAQAYTLFLRITDTATGKVVRTLEKQVPAGEGIHEETVAIPAVTEGTFDLSVVDAGGRPCDRVTQFLVVDTRRPASPKPRKELIATIDCAKQAPDYALPGGTRVVDAAFGAYRETGSRGRVEDLENADWFAYTLHLPAIQELYLAEVDTPDDDQRTFLISLVEEAANPYAPTLGVASGGEFSLSQKLQTHQFYFYPRQQDPRLFLQTWYRGQRAAVARIRLYRVSAPPQTAVRAQGPARRYGFYQEEPLRFTSYFGAMPEGNSLANIWRAADRLGLWAEHVGANLWHPTIAVYQSMMWPGQTIPGYGPSDTDGYGIIGPPTLKEPFRKDLVRLMLLASEKHGMDFVGELHVPANMVLMRALDRRFGGKGTIEDDGPQKPWLIVARDGTVGQGVPRYNPLHPGVQEWVASMLSELGERYKDSPAFKGVALRLMGWQFSSWQALPSLHWGYEDTTIGLFEAETGVKVPVPADDPKRFGKRYDWLMANACERWVEWRCRKVHAYHQRLAAALAKARPDLALHLDLYGPTWDDRFCRALSPREYEEKGWLGILRESGLDPALYGGDRNIVINETRAYPPAMRTTEPLQAAVDRQLFYDPQLIAAAARPAAGGSVGAIHFDAQSMEGEMVRADQLGLPAKMLLHNKTTAHGAGVINPAGRHYLSRFADAMADGNVTFLHDGSHGYEQGQPQYLREFTAEYRALPAAGMERLKGTGDPVALWWGRSGKGVCFYVVNRASYPVQARVTFSGPALHRRLSTGLAAAPDHEGVLRVSLAPYQLLAFGSASAPKGLAVTVPAEVKKTLAEQVAFAGRLLAGEGPSAGVTLVPFSLVQKRAAEGKLAEARRELAAGHTVMARRALMHHRLVRVYEAFGAYPPDLLFRKAPPTPERAMAPQTLLERADAEGRQAAAVVPAERLSPSLAGEQVLSWKEKPLSIRVDVPRANRFRLSYAFASGEGYDRPAFALDGTPVPGQDEGAVQRSPTWGRATVLPLLALQPGEHRLEMRPRGGAAAGLFHVSLDPVYHDLAASDWMVIGPFPSGGDRNRGPGPGFGRVYPPEARREFGAAYEGDAGRRVSWLRPEAPDAYVNLHQLTGAFNWRVGYAATTLESPEERDAELQFGVDYWARIWLNGERVFELSEPHGPPCRAQYTVPVHLRKGPNELLVKIHAGSAGNGFWMAVSDPGDLKVDPRQGG